MVRDIVSLLVFASLLGQTASSPSGQMMKAAGLAAPQKQSAAKATLFSVPMPVPGARDVLVQVKASSVNHLDLLWKTITPGLSWDAAQTLWSLSGGFPKVLGMDVTGTVIATGSDVKRLKVGDDVWAFNAAAAVFDGKTLGGLAGHAWAPYVALREQDTGIKPKSINFTEAGVLPLVALTSLHSLKLAGAPWKNGSTVLILGGSGGVGHVAVQQAKALGATTVITTASGKNRAFVLSLGADRLIDYHSENWWNDSVIPDGSLDAVFDTVLQPLTGDRAYAKLKDGGSFVSLCSGIPVCGAPMPSLINKLKRPSVHSEAVRCTAGACASVEFLDELSSMVDAGKLRGHVDKVGSLSDIEGAVNLLTTHHGVGKIGLTIDTSMDEVVV